MLRLLQRLLKRHGERRDAAPWSLDIKGGGRGWTITYREREGTVRFDSEFGGPFGATIFCDPAQVWDERYPWAAGRRKEIVERVATEFVRRKFRGGMFELGGDVLRPRFDPDGAQMIGFEGARSDDIITVRRRTRR